MKVIALVSGGLDSAVMISRLLQTGYDVHALFVDYGQPAMRAELAASARVTKYFGVPLATFEMRMECEQLRGSDACVVPGRNMALIAAAINVTGTIPAQAIAIGVTAADRDYPDTRAAFTTPMRQCVECYGLQFLTPLSTWGRTTVAACATSIGLEIGLAWSCYRDGNEPCRECAGCKQGDHCNRCGYLHESCICEGRV